MLVVQNQSHQRWTVLVLGEIVVRFETYFRKNGKCLKQHRNIRTQKILSVVYQCCDKDLGDAILKGHADIVNFSEQEHYLAACCYSCFYCCPTLWLLSSKQNLSKNIKSFAACLKGKATMCSYSCTCKSLNIIPRLKNTNTPLQKSVFF